MKRPSKEQPRTNPSAASPVEPASLWSATQSVEVPEGKTITEYLSQHGLQRGVELDQSVAEYAAASILRVEGGRKYEVGRLIAKGGMGVVNEAKDLNYRRTVAMKVLSKDVQSRPEDLLRFIEEAQVTSQLEHPNIIPVHELGLDQDGNVFYTMKFVKGVTLTEVLDNVRRGHQEVIEQFPLGRLLTIFQKACDAVAFAHSKGVVHRDLKPDNIMIGDFGEVLVMDWGLAKVLRRQAVSTTPQVPMMEQAEPATVDPASLSRRKKKGEQDTSIDSIRTDTVGSGLRTISGRVMGTPGFMAPEQASARADDIDTRSDVYCMGAILYSILTLRPPVKTKNIRTTLRKIIHGDIPPPVSFNPPGPGAKARAKTKVRKPEKVVVLSHLPGGQIPVILSDIAMKAMSVNPVERYQTVQELQHDIEAYQEGLIWHLVVDEDFSDPDILSRWEVIGGQHEIKEGELRLYGGEPQILLLKKDVPGDVRIEFECRQESVYLNDVGCFVGAIRSANRKEIPSSGYELKYGGYDNSLNVLMRSNQKIWSDQASPLVRGKIYRVRAERIGSRLRMAVNNEDVFKVTDRDPLSGPDRTAVGLLGWMADTRYTRIRVYSLGTPWKSDILDTAERHLQKGHYVTAADLFKEVLDSYPDSDRLERAKKGYATARHRRQLMENLPESKEKLQRAWPSAAVQIRMDNDGLTVEITNAGITDLSPLKGLPLTSLYCAGNRIESLEPLRGMSLVTLNCSGNAIESLDALRGMPLTTLICECCRITSLEPLRGMALTMLNCGGNALANGLEPLRDMPLTWLSCWGNDLDALDPIADMKLSTLYMDANRVQSLEPLHGMPLATLHCNGNRIEDLEPLRGMSLNALHCGGNQLRSLEPLRGMLLTMFSCHCNRIKSVDPLKGMRSGFLLCGGNELASVEFLVKNPPDTFLFDCDTLPTSELEFIQSSWSRDFRFAAHVRNVDVLLAMRKRDVARMKSLASSFEGRKYLFVPKFLTWEKAREYCEQVGGHLVTIASREENEFIASMMPSGSWFWLGLRTTETGQQWVTGEPFHFSTFVDVQRERAIGPKVFFNGAWSYDVWPEACNCFMIEWEK